MRHTATAAALAAALLLGGVGQAHAQTEVRMVSFSGATNLPGWVADEKGFFAKRAAAPGIPSDSAFSETEAGVPR